MAPPPETTELVVDLANPDTGLRKACVQLLPDWRKADPADIKIKTIEGGTTNLLYRCEHAGRRVLVRIYGANTEQLIDRDKEIALLRRFGEIGFSVKLLGVFGNGRIEEWLELEACSAERLMDPTVTRLVAQALGKMHRLEPPREFPREPVMWPTLDKWLAIAESVKFEDAKKQAVLEATIDLRSIRLEISRMKKLLAPTAWPMHFCHNDLLSANVMLSRDDSECKLIDFEYAAFNFRGFDLGNHFNEFAGLECDYSKYPKREQQYRFFRPYLVAMGKYETEDAVPESVLAGLYTEANQFALVSHLHWGLWSLVQAKYSSIDFDFLDYARLRFEAYFDAAQWTLNIA